MVNHADPMTDRSVRPSYHFPFNGMPTNIDEVFLEWSTPDGLPFARPCTANLISKLLHLRTFAPRSALLSLGGRILAA